MTLPPEYVSYCAGTGPQEGGLTVEPGWFQLWPLDEVAQLNNDYQIPESIPGFLGFGSSGGGELLAFDAAGRIVMIPFIPISAEEARLVADSWGDFVEKIEP